MRVCEPPRKISQKAQIDLDDLLSASGAQENVSPRQQPIVIDEFSDHSAHIDSEHFNA